MLSGNRLKSILIPALLAFAAFLCRFWHLDSTGWVSGDESFILGMRTTDHSIFHFSDASVFDRYAGRYLEGKGLDIPFLPPFTIWTLIAIYKLLGHSFYAAKVVYALLGSLAIIPIYITAREAFGISNARVTATLCAFSFTLISTTGGLNTENIYLFTLSTTICLYTIIYRGLWGAAKNLVPFAFIFGIGAGAAFLTRSEFAIVLSAMFILGIFKKEWDAKKKLKISLAAIIAMILLIAPWTYRNYIVMTDFNEKVPYARLPVFVPGSLNGPFNFLEGHNSKANGTYAPDVVGEDLKSGYETNLDYRNERHLEYVREGYRLGWEYIKNNPARELELLGVKLRIFMNGLAGGFGLRNFPAGIEGVVESMADSFVPLSGIMLWMGMPLFLLGTFFSFRKRDANASRHLPLMAIGASLAVALSFYALTRMAYPVLPYYYMLMAEGCVYLATASGLYRRLPEWSAAALIAILLSVSFMHSRELLILEKKPDGEFGRFTVSIHGSLAKQE